MPLLKIKIDPKDKKTIKKIKDSLAKKEALNHHVKSGLPLKLFKQIHR